MNSINKLKKIASATKRENIDTPLVSIVCTTFNQKKFIKDTLDGFLIQKTTFPIEIIVHDDASSDGTSEIIKAYERKYPHLFKPIYQIENQYSKKVNIANKFIFPRIKGKYIATCEGDDYWIDPLKLQKQVDFLEEYKEYALVYTDINRIDEDGNIIDREFLKSNHTPIDGTFEEYLIKAPFMAPCTWIFRKSVYKERDRKYAVGDLPMILDILSHSKIHKLDFVTTNYRVLSNSASHFTNLLLNYRFMKGVYDIQMDYAEKYNMSIDVIKAIKTKYAWDSYNFAVAQHDIHQIKTADKLLIGHPDVDYKFKVIQLLSKFKLGRLLVKTRLKKILKYD